MASLQVRGADFSVTKQKALEDAKKMQASVQDECTRAGKDAPPYNLLELIGKGSFGRVYRATDLNTKKVVAVKIIDIEESDTLNPKLADTYSEFIKEITALKLLSDSGAKNINHVLDALPVGQAMWMVTEYCAGGSVSTLMKPTAPGGLQEKWIIPILREVAEAIYWVHQQGIIHRDIKCANVLVTESGSVQLCDFGVAGIIETKVDKRSTIIGTPHWMAPELFDPSASYGTEVDIWAFGSMVYEIASGLPPNVRAGIDVHRLGNYLKSHTPRLEGDQYTPQLKDVVAFCLVDDPAQRPTIDAVQRHPYISNTSAAYPSSSLANLVKGYKLWEAQGGSRKSLFSAGGAQAPSVYASTALANDEWNFSTTVDFDRRVLGSPDAQAVYDVYGSNVDFSAGFNEETARPGKQSRSRRRPPPQLPAVKAPLEKVFDPNTISNYEENARVYYGKPPPPPNSDLPLRDDSLHATLRESLIDLDASLNGGDISQFRDMDTMTAAPLPPASEYDFDDTTDFAKAPLSDPAELNNNRKTQEWKFPTMPPPASANPEMSRFPFSVDERLAAAPAAGPSNVNGTGSRPPLVHHPTDPEPLVSKGYDLMAPPARPQDNRVSTGSLIDLDESLPMVVTMSGDYSSTRPSTANSDAASVEGSDFTAAGNPFELERHASLYRMPFPGPGGSTREPSIYVSDDSEFLRPARLHEDMDVGPEDMVVNDQAGVGGVDGQSRRINSYSAAGDFLDAEYLSLADPQSRAQPQGAVYGEVGDLGMSSIKLSNGGSRMLMGMGPVRNQSLPPIVPAAPSERAMQGLAGREEVKDEVMRMLASFSQHLQFANEQVMRLPVRRARQERGVDGVD